jgi:C1A family cysteine protease
MFGLPKYHWKKDVPDNRDSLFAPAPSTVIPPHVDLRPFCSPVEDQGQIGSCTGNSIAGAIEFIDYKNNNKIDVSRLFIYYQERVLEHDVKVDGGGLIRDGIKQCAKLGAPLESLWPYDVSKFAVKPTHEAYADALNRRISSYHRIVGLEDALKCLAEGFPFVFGFTVYESFESNSVAATGIMPMPKANEKNLGGHAVLCVGYDTATKRLIVRNSWGPNWGQAGYFTMPFDYVTTPGMSDDFWTVRC